jgi:hypothetical protein
LQISYTHREAQEIMYESKKQPVLPRQKFVQRLISHLGAACALLIASLGLGMFGYANLEHLSVIDAFLNAAMLLGGMGPVNAPQTEAGKLFAGFYALYAGLVFIVTAALVFTPLLHRLLHRFHLDD